MNFYNHPKNEPDVEDRVYKHVLMLYYFNAKIKINHKGVDIKTTRNIDEVIEMTRVAFADIDMVPSKKYFYEWLKRKGIKPLGLRIEQLSTSIIHSWFEEINGETI